MLKGTRSLAPGKSLSGLGLVIVISGVLFTSIACQELTTDASPSSDAAIAVASSSPVDTESTTPPTGGTAPSTCTTASPGGSGTPPEETTTTRPIIYRPTTVSLIPFTLTWVRFEETDPRLLFTGDWLRDESPLASGGSFNYGRGATAGGAKVQIVFDGTQIRFVALRCVDCGIAKLTLDSWPPVYVDPYSTDWVSEVVWTSGVMPFGRHTLWIERSGDRNPAASGTILRFDAVDVIGTLVD